MEKTDVYIGVRGWLENVSDVLVIILNTLGSKDPING